MRVALPTDVEDRLLCCLNGTSDFAFSGTSRGTPIVTSTKPVTCTIPWFFMIFPCVSRVAGCLLQPLTKLFFVPR